MPTLAAGNSIAPTLAASRAALQIRSLGFTLLELLVVVAIIAMGTVGVGLAMRDSGDTQLEREGQRLASMLESARAQSRATGVAVRWRNTEAGFLFTGLTGPASNRSADHWQSEGITVQTPTELSLGPEPLIGHQEVVLSLSEQPGRTVRVVTDGLRPFAVVPFEPIVGKP